MTTGNPAAFAVVAGIFLAIGGVISVYAYRFLMQRERRLMARQQAEQQELEHRRAEAEYIAWLRSADIGVLDRMTGIEFEHALAELFSDLGCGAVVTQASRDYGADVVLSRGGQKIVVQAKRYVGTLGLDAVQQATAAHVHYGAVRGTKLRPPYLLLDASLIRAAERLGSSLDVAGAIAFCLRGRDRESPVSSVHGAAQREDQAATSNR